jgi:hypothetical protein
VYWLVVKTTNPRKEAVKMLGRFFAQVRCWKKGDDEAPGLPLAQVLTQESIEHALGSDQTDCDAPIYPPWVTLWMFLTQVLSTDHLCRQTVMRLLAYRTACNQPACSAKTGAYCHARNRLPEKLVRDLVHQTGEKLHRGAPLQSRSFHGRSVKVIDGATVAMPDTKENTVEFGKSTNQHRTSNFPLARLVTLFCLVSGAVIAAEIAAYCGKKTGELSLFRLLRAAFAAGDILLGDELYCTFCDLAQLIARGVDMVTSCGARQQLHFEQRTRLGPDDYLVVWHKPEYCPDWLTRAEFDALPPTLTLRLVRVHVTTPGFRTKTLQILTTLVDAQVWTSDEIAQLYRARWHEELDLRSLKTTLQMEMLRCKKPSLVWKEIWVHLLAYNLLRSLMGVAAAAAGTQVRGHSLQATRQALNSFLWLLATASEVVLDEIGQRMLAAIAQHVVGDRPDRFEPRKQKRRPKPYPFLTGSRQQERQRCLNDA